MKKLLNLFVLLMLVLAFAVSGFAAGSQVTVLDGTYTEIYNVTFSAGSDTYYSMTHSLGSAPDEVYITPYDVNCTAIVNTGSSDVTGMPYVNGTADIGATSVGIAKGNVPQSATCAARVLVRVTHSIIR